MRRITTLIVGLALAVAGLFVVAPQGQASDANYTWAYSQGRGYQITIGIKCHTDNEWHQLRPGQNTAQVCPGSGWIERTLVSAPYHVVATNRNAPYGETSYPTGCNCSIGGGYYNLNVYGTANAKHSSKITALGVDVSKAQYVLIA